MADELVCEKFEGAPSRYNFTEFEWQMVVLSNKPVLIKTFDDKARKLMDTRLMRFPLSTLSARLSSLISGTEKNTDMRYVLYSAHDTQIANLLEFFSFDDFHYTAVPFTSQFYLEVYANEDCMNQHASDEQAIYSSCVRVHMTFQGQQLKVKTCLESNKQRGVESEDCFYSDFLEHMHSISQEGDLDALCYQPFVPPQ